MSNELMLCNQSRFSSNSDMLARPAPASTMVLQQLIEALAAINQKVDALAVRQEQSPERMYPQRDNVVVRRVERTPIQISQPMVSTPSVSSSLPRIRINRSRLMEIFE